MKQLNDQRQGLLLEFPADGTPLDANGTLTWATNFKSIILHHTKGLLPDVSCNLENDECTSALFYKLDNTGHDIAGNSISIREGAKLSSSQVAALENAILALHKITESDNCACENADFLRNFRLPHPQHIPEAWRISNSGRQLILLWGYYTNNSLDTTFLPLTSVSAHWNDAGRRQSIRELLKPHTSATDKIIRCAIAAVIACLFAILALLLFSNEDVPAAPEPVADVAASVAPAETATATTAQLPASEATTPSASSDDNAAPQVVVLKKNKASTAGSSSENQVSEAPSSAGDAQQQHHTQNTLEDSKAQQQNTQNNVSNSDKQKNVMQQNTQSRNTRQDVQQKDTDNSDKQENVKRQSAQNNASNSDVKQDVQQQENARNQRASRQQEDNAIQDDDDYQQSVTDSRKRKNDIAKLSDERKQLEDDLKHVEKRNEKNQQDIASIVKDIDKDSTVSEEDKKTYRDVVDSQNSDAEQHAINTISQKEQQNTATADEKKLKQQLVDTREQRQKNRSDSKKIQRDIDQKDQQIAQLHQQEKQAEQDRNQFAKTQQNPPLLPEDLKVCQQCARQSLDLSVTISVEDFQEQHGLCKITLQLIPSCRNCRNLKITSFKIGYIFQRDFYFNPNTRSLSFNLKKSELKDDNWRISIDYEIDHNQKTCTGAIVKKMESEKEVVKFILK